MSEPERRPFEVLTGLSDTELLSKLKDHIISHSILKGDFVLKSGQSSRWFIDAKKTVCSPEGMLMVAAAVSRRIPDLATAIGGLTMGADPVAFATAAWSSALGRPLRSFSVRKEVKDHGGGGRVAGMLLPGDMAVITEDTVTRGTSMLDAVRAVRESGAMVAMAIAMVDRGGSAAGLLAREGVRFEALFDAKDLGFDFEGGLDLMKN